jgi:hypothetical protein
MHSIEAYRSFIQFTWEAVKDDKFRENYLGHSLMAPVGRWQQGNCLKQFNAPTGSSFSFDSML